MAEQSKKLPLGAYVRVLADSVFKDEFHKGMLGRVLLSEVRGTLRDGTCSLVVFIDPILSNIFEVESTSREAGRYGQTLLRVCEYPTKNLELVSIEDVPTQQRFSCEYLDHVLAFERAELVKEGRV